MYDDISICGITDLDLYPNCSCTKYYSQYLDDEVLFIPDSKLDIKTINEVSVNLCINEYNVINTILGPKLIICGCSNIKVVYTADNCMQSLHSAHWSIPFVKYILLKDLSFNECSLLVDSLFIGLEGVFVKHYNSRCIDLSILYIICPTINEKSNSCNHCSSSCYYNRGYCYSNSSDDCSTNSSSMYSRTGNYASGVCSNNSNTKNNSSCISSQSRTAPRYNKFTRKK